LLFRKFDEEFDQGSMVWANTQISNNTFINNIGCFSKVGALRVTWYTNNYDTDPAAKFNSESDPNPMSNNKDVSINYFISKLPIKN
jgi:hypothetical protein